MRHLMYYRNLFWVCDMCCTMVHISHGHRFACSVLLQLGSRAPIAIKWPAAVLVIWPHFNGNEQRRPRSASLGLALFSSRICRFLCTCTSNGHPRGKSNPPRGCQKNTDSVLFGRLAFAFLWSSASSGLSSNLVANERKKNVSYD